MCCYDKDNSELVELGKGQNDEKFGLNTYNNTKMELERILEQKISIEIVTISIVELKYLDPELEDEKIFRPTGTNRRSKL